MKRRADNLAARARPQGFSLLEVMVAMVIFSLVLTALLTAFRTGTKAYDVGRTHSEADQAARYAIGQITDDLRNVFYRTPSSYNVTRRQREAQRAQLEEQALKSGVAYDPLSDPNAPELGPRIDLSFKATDGGEADELSFVRLQSLKHGEDRKPWGLARLRYYISGDSFYRSVDDIMMPDVDEDGVEIPKATTPRVDKLANNIKSFDLKFGYYFDTEWQLADDWNSDEARYRNPPEDDEDSLEGVITTGGLTTGTLAQRIQLDELPAWVEITFKFTDPKKTEKEKVYRQVLQIAQSQETYLPPEAGEGAAARGPFSRRSGARR